MAEVVFDVETFRKRHPAFQDEVKAPEEALVACFDQAVEMIGNEDSQIPYEPNTQPPIHTRAVVLDLITCHIATQSLLWDATQTGPVASAGEGSVNVSFGSMSEPGSSAWWMSTRCGAQAWQIVKQYTNGPLYFGVEHFYFGG